MNWRRNSDETTKMKQTKFYEIYERKVNGKTQLLTKNLVSGNSVYDEELVRDGKSEFRTWDPFKSKLAAGIINGMQHVQIKPGDIVLYLGAASGTTPSHISDIVGKQGFVFALDFAPRVVRDLYFVCRKRRNMGPMLEDALFPENYSKLVPEVDFVYQDIAQKSQADIFIRNCDKFLKKGGFGILCVKARSINVVENPKTIFKQVRKQLEDKLTIIDYRELDPFEKDHAIFVVKKK